jgi:hypothetical protein
MVRKERTVVILGSGTLLGEELKGMEGLDSTNKCQLS